MPALFAAGAEFLGGLFGGGAAAVGAGEGIGIGTGAALGADAGAFGVGTEVGLGGAGAFGVGTEALGAGTGLGLGSEALGGGLGASATTDFGALASGPGSDAFAAASPMAGSPLSAGSGAFDVGGGSALGGGGATGQTAFGVDSAASSLGAGGPIGVPPANPGAGAPQGLFDQLVTGATKSVTSNPLGVGLGAAGLAYNIYNGRQTSAEEAALKRSAGTLNAQGQQLMSYLQSGTLPTGLQAAVTQANAAAKARTIANHAHNGQSTDPSQNSALAQELNSIDQQSTIQVAQIGQQLLTTGINETGLSDQLYAQLIGIDRQQAQSTGYAIANFAAALNGGRAQQPPQQRA